MGNDVAGRGGRAEPDAWRVWQAALLRQRAGAMSTFVAACTQDRTRARAAGELEAEVFAASLEDLTGAREAVATLERWTEEFEDHPHRPPEVRPAEADAQARDHVKDILAGRLPPASTEWRFTVRLFTGVIARRLRRCGALDASARADLDYLEGRITMALDLGHRRMANHELARLRALETDVHARHS